MKRLDVVHRGHVSAAAVIIDAPTIGEPAARARVLGIIEPTDRLLALPDARWLLVSEDVTEIDTASAPGVALTRDGDALSASPAAVVEAGVAEFRFGDLATYPLSSLPSIERSGWFDLGPALHLRPIDDTPSAPSVAAEAPKAPNLREKAGVGETSAATSKVIRELASGRSGAPRPTAARRRRQRKGGTGAADPPKRPLRSALASLVMRTPASDVIGRRHARYIESLTRQFESGNLDEALHRAIPLGGGLARALSLKLPQRRQNLAITSGQRGGSVPYGSTVHEHLRQLYRDAAARLEALGEIDEAAFVLAELLGDPNGCIALLERHRQFETAARIAESRKLDPALAVRLWWLAKNRTRALEVARLRGAFAPAVTRLEQTDPEAAMGLRVEWMAHLEQAGNLLGAVQAGWPAPDARRLLVNILARGEQLEGPTGGALRAYALAFHASDERIAAALDLATRSDDPTGARDAFLLTFSQHPAADEVDRRIATAYVRANPLPATGGESTQWWQISRRADAALVADLPRGTRPDRAPALPLRPPSLPAGQVPINDAAAFASGDVLVAAGALGSRLLRRDGRTVAEWHQPVSNIVMADHGGSALLLDVRQSGEVDVHRLDLTTRRVSRYGTIELEKYVDSFDGAQWLVIDKHNAAMLDLTRPSPTIVWRPLEPGARAHSLLRTPHQIFSLVTVRRGAGEGQSLELRAWDGTATFLQQRRTVHFHPDVLSYRLVPNGYLTVQPLTIDINTGNRTLSLQRDDYEAVWSAGDLLVTTTKTESTTILQVELLASRTSVIRMPIVGDTEVPNVRCHGSLVTLWTADGTIHVVDVKRGCVVSSIRAML